MCPDLVLPLADFFADMINLPFFGFLVSGAGDLRQRQQETVTSPLPSTSRQFCWISSFFFRNCLPAFSAHFFVMILSKSQRIALSCAARPCSLSFGGLVFRPKEECP